MKNIDYVIHLAAISNDPAALLNSQITWETNVLNTYHLLELCKNNVNLFLLHPEVSMV